MSRPVVPPHPLVVLFESEERRGARLLREAADAIEVATYSGEDMETALGRVLAAIGRQVYLDAHSDARALLVYSISRQLQEDA